VRGSSQSRQSGLRQRSDRRLQTDVCVQTSMLDGGIGVGINPGNAKSIRRLTMLLALAIVLLIIAVAGGVVIHPLLFLIAVLALVAFFGGRRHSAY